MYCHHCNREPCECVAGTYAASTNMTPPKTNPQVSDDDGKFTDYIISHLPKAGTTDTNLAWFRESLVQEIAQYRHRITSQSADIIQRQKDALRVADKTLKQINHDFLLQVAPNSATLHKEALTIIQPLLKD